MSFRSHEADVFFCEIPDLQMELPDALLKKFPEHVVSEIFLYQKQPDRIRLLTGKLLLYEMVISQGFPAAILDHYSVDDIQRPYITGFYDFNITHSGHLVACACMPGSRVGIDCEKIREIKPGEFTKQFSPPEMQRLLSAPDPQEQFFEYWTQKEAVMKADGRGMRIPLHSIRLKGDYATIDDRDGKWFLQKLDLLEGYKSHLCSPDEVKTVRLSRKDFF